VRSPPPRRPAAPSRGSGAEAQNVDIDVGYIESNGLRGRAGGRQSLLANRASQAHQFLSKTTVGLFATAAGPNQLGKSLAGHGEGIGQSQAGENGHGLTARQRNGGAIIAAKLKGTEQAQL
jgi:hypothetical protein